MSRLYAFLLLVACVHCKAPEGYTVNSADGYAYKLVYEAQPWNTARDLCAADGGKLAVPKSDAQFAFIQDIVKKMHYPSIVGGSDYKLLAWIGIDSQGDSSVWRNVDGQDIKDNGFHKWAGNNGKIFSADPKEPHCVGIDAANEGLRDYWCSHKQPYICETKTTA